MNTDRLARWYDTLTPWERVPLLLAASARADAVEQDRLARSAPKYGFRVPDYWGLAEGLEALAQSYLLQQLDLAACYWKWTALQEQNLPWESAIERQQRQQRFGQTRKMLAYRCVVCADGWRLLCLDLKIDPDFLLREVPGYEAVQQMETLSRLIAFRAEEAIDYLRETLDLDAAPAKETAAIRKYRMQTAAEVAQEMRAFLRAKLDAWR